MVNRYDFLISEDVNKMIEVIVNKADKRFRQDLKQELYLKLLEILNSERLNSIKNKSGYVYASLKNKAKEFLIRESAITSCLIKYDEEILYKPYDTGKIDILIFDFLQLTTAEKQLLYDFFVMGYTQKEIAIKRKTSQQQIHNQINKLKNKIKKII